jgi:uncharacterized protein YecT (DUF1311 family)
VIAAAALLLLAQAEIAEPDQVCDDPQTQLAMNTCASMEFNAADVELNAQWEATSVVMEARDAGREPGDQQPGYFETLLAAQRAWQAYRDAECLSQSFMARGGSMQPMLNMQCKTYLTELRTEQLRVLAAGPE